MAFLAPAELFLAAAIAGPLLLLLYVLKLRRRPVRVGSILFWTPAIQDAQANEPFQRPRFSWLLVLHFIILLLVVCAVGRPVLKDAQAMGDRTVIILDASASMAATDANSQGTRLDRAKAKAIDRIKLILGGGGGFGGFMASPRRVCLITSSAETTLTTPFTASASLLSDAVNAVQQTDQPGNLAAAVALARSASSTADEQMTTANGAAIMVLTDGGEQAKPSASTEGSQRSGITFPGVTFEYIGAPASTPAPKNAGLTLLTVRRDTRKLDTIRAFIQVSSNALEEWTIPITLSLNGRIIAQRPVTVAARAGPDALPARATLTIEVDQVGSGLLLATLGQADALAADNQAGIVLDAASRPSLLLVSPASAPDKPDSSPASWLLADALAELDARSFDRITAEEYSRRLGAGANGGELTTADCLVFDRVTPAVVPKQPSISFGACPPVPGVTLVSAEKGGGGGSFFWQRTHPLLQNATLDSLIVTDRSHFVVEEKPSVKVEEVVTGGNGPAMLSITYRGVRHIAVAFDLSKSNWPLQPSFSIFLADAARLLLERPGNAAGRMFTTTEPVIVRANARASTLTISGPTTFDVQVPDRAGEGVIDVSLGVLKRVGAYTIQGPTSLDRAAAVNLLNEPETSLASVSPTTASAPRRETTADDDRAVRMELWPLCLAVVTALLLIEWLIYGMSLRA